MTNKHNVYVDNAAELLALMLGVNGVGLFLMELEFPDQKNKEMKERSLELLKGVDTYLKRKAEGLEGEIDKILSHPVYWNSIERENGDEIEFGYTDNIVSLFRDKE